MTRPPFRIRGALSALVLFALPAAPVAAAPSGAPAPGAGGAVNLAIGEEPVTQVLAMLERLTGKTVIADPAIPRTKITFRPPHGLSRDEAVMALESLLSLNGVALTPLGERFLKAVPAGAPAAQGAPELHLESVRNLPPSERVVARLFSLKDADAASVAEKLKPLMTGRAVITVLRESNALLVTDSLTNLIRAEDFVAGFDRPVATYEPELKNMRAETLAAKLKVILAGAYKRRLRGEVSVDALDGANRLLITTAPENLEAVKGLVALLDTGTGTAAKVEVFPLRCAEAVKMAAVIKELAGGRNAAGATAARPAEAAPAAGDERFSGGMSLVADERSNSIIVQGSPEDIAKIRKLLERLDVVLPQVQIEATIIEVTLNEGDVSGLQSLGLGYKSASGTGVTGNGKYTFNTGTPALENTGQQAFTVSGSVDSLSLAAALNQDTAKGRVKVLSSPTIVTTHNKKAVINVSQSQPIITGVTSSIQNTGATQSTVNYRDIGIKLEVTPRIGVDGVIQMEVSQTVENLAGNTQIDGNTQPIIGKREATSYLTANDGQMIVLAGLQSTSDNQSEGKVWLLGHIPGLDWIFSPESNTHRRSELMVFLTPRVVDLKKIGATPKIHPDALIAPDMGRFLKSGRAPSPLEDTWAAKERKREEEAERARTTPPRREPMRGMHDH